MKHSDLTKKEVDKFHKDLDKLVHKTFGHSSDEKKDIKNEMNKYGLTAKAIDGKFYSYRNGKLTGTFNNIKDLQKHQAELIQDESMSVKEDLALMAQKAEMDHEVQMARSDLYKAAKYSIKLHEMLKQVSEQQGLEGWVAAKITKASDYLSSVYHYMEYEMMSETVTYLDEGWLDTIKAAGRAITPDSVKALFDPATAAKVRADDQAKVQMQTLLNDVNTVAALNQTDVSQGYPTDLVAAYLRKYVEPRHPEAFKRMDAQGDLRKMFPPKGKVDANTLKSHLSKVAQELGKVDLSPEPQAKPQAQTQPQAQPQTQNSSIDYKESLTNKLQSKLKESKNTCKDCGKPTWETLDEAEKQKGVDGKVCWKGYKRMGTKMKGGKRVDNCVPIKKKK